MASVTVSPPSTNGTTNDYGGITGLTLVRSETTNSVTTQTGTNFRMSQAGNNAGPVVIFSLTQSGTDIGLNLPQSTATDVTGTPGGIYQTLDYNLQLAGATNVSTSGTGTMVTNFTTNYVFTSDPGTSITIGGTFLLQGQYPMGLGLTSANVQYISPVNTTSQVTVAVYTFTNNTGDSVTVEGTTITDGSTLAVAITGQYFDITYTEPESESEDPYQEQEQTEQEQTEQEETPAPTVSTIAPVYIYGTGAIGFGTGLTGYFYPLYTDINAPALSGGYHIHTFTEYEGYTFYMPNGSMNHAMADRPIGINLYITGNTVLDNLEPIGANNPDYSTLLPQIASETDASQKQLLINQTYQFNSPLSQAEEDLFAYINSGYIQDNPNATDGSPDAFISYVGVYYDQFGRSTGTVAAQQNVVIQQPEQTEETEQTATVAEYGIAEYGIAEYGA